MRREWLRVRTIRSLGGDERAEARRVVWCAASGASKPLDECVACVDCEGVAGDPDGKRSLVLCARPAERKDPLAKAPTDGATEPVVTIMRRETLCVRPETTVDALYQLFFGRGISGAPVVGDDGVPIGLVSHADILRHVGDPPDVEKSALEPGFHVESDPVTARDVMTAEPITIHETEPISRAAAVMAFEGVHRLPVVDAFGAIVGIVTSLDVMRWLARHDGFRVPDYTQRQR